MDVRVTDGKLSICHCAVPFGWNQREMRAFKGQAKLRLRPDMLWCAPQIRAKRLYCFSSVSPLCSPVFREWEEDRLKRKKLGIKKGSERDREREWWGWGHRISQEQVACLPLPQRAVLIKHSLVEFAWCFRTAGVMRRGGWNRGMLGLYGGSFLTVSECFAFQPFPFPALSRSLQQSHCLQRAFDWEHFDSAGCEAWA